MPFRPRRRLPAPPPTIIVTQPAVEPTYVAVPIAVEVPQEQIVAEPTLPTETVDPVLPELTELPEEAEAAVGEEAPIGFADCFGAGELSPREKLVGGVTLGVLALATGWALHRAWR